MILFEKRISIARSMLTRPLISNVYDFEKSNILDIVQSHYLNGYLDTYFTINDYELAIKYNCEEAKLDNGYVRKIINWSSFEESLKKSKLFIELISEDNYKYFIFKYPKEWILDFTHIKNGEYSKVSTNYINKFYASKDNFLFHFKWKTEEAIDYYSKKFNVDKKLFKKCEIGPKVDLEKEMYKPKILS